MGVGNPLMRDEGVGVHVAALLQRLVTFPGEVEVIDAGTMGLGILNLFRDIDYLLVVDAVDGTEHPAGTVVRMSPEDIRPNQVMHSMHDVRFADVLEAAELMGHRPEADFIGVQIELIEQFVEGLTPAVEAAVPAAAAAVLATLTAHDIAWEPAPGEPTDEAGAEALRLVPEMR
jgi:hydrogenase maturation protease